MAVNSRILWALAPLVTLTISRPLVTGAAAGETYTPAERRHWAFQPARTSGVPAFSSPEDRKLGPKNPIDASSWRG